MVETSNNPNDKGMRNSFKLEDEFGTLDANKALEIYERLSKTCMSQPKENKTQTEKPNPTRCLTVNNQEPAQKPKEPKPTCHKKKGRQQIGW